LKKQEIKNPAALLEEAAALLVEIAGDEPLHIEMAGIPGMKYAPVRHCFALEDARLHLSGKSTRGARIRRQDGQTRAICVDADNPEEWSRLEIACQVLYYRGYRCLLEPAPSCSLHPGGGHLWVIYDGLVDARSAWKHLCELAPVFDGLEYWPARAQNVRLPAGVYRTPAANEQCLLYDALGLVASNRKEAAQILLTYQTPAAIVPNYPAEPESKQASTRREVKFANLANLSPESDLIAWFNSTHSITDYLQAEIEHPGRGTYMARGTWRGERGRPSVEVHPETNTAYDYGTRERLDCFEAACLVENKSKKELAAEVREAWLASRGPSRQPEPEGGLPVEEKPTTLFPVQKEQEATKAPYDGPYPPPDRLSLCCSAGWQWVASEQAYRCAECIRKQGSHAA
jgi:hypothetical protein